MKQRILGAILTLLVCGPGLILGGVWLKVLVAAVALIASYEYTSIRNKRFNIAIYVLMVAFIAAINVLPQRSTGIILFYIMLLFFFGILFEDISMDDISSTFMMSIILAFAIMCVLRIYERSSYLVMLYIAIAAFGCDIFALFTGMAIGKHKLNPRVSPKKTWEGAIGGWLGGALLSYLFAHFLGYLGFDQKIILFFSLTLPIISQIGDLSFSLIKRNYEVKDYGSLIPGHGGILDRIDSLLFCLIFFGSVGVFFGL